VFLKSSNCNLTNLFEMIEQDVASVLPRLLEMVSEHIELNYKDAHGC
jgi:hypothetical protein